jgi:hypothetical protein
MRVELSEFIDDAYPIESAQPSAMPYDIIRRAISRAVLAQDDFRLAAAMIRSRIDVAKVGWPLHGAIAIRCYR